MGRSRIKNDGGKGREESIIGGPGGRRSRGRPRRKLVDDVDTDLRRLGARRWRRVAQDRVECRHVVLEARALREL